MKITFGPFMTLLLSYIAAAPLTELISFDLRETEWANILTYVWWMFSLFIWVGIIAVVVMLLAAIGGRR